MRFVVNLARELTYKLSSGPFEDEVGQALILAAKIVGVCTVAGVIAGALVGIRAGRTGESAVIMAIVFAVVLGSLGIICGAIVVAAALRGRSTR